MQLIDTQNESDLRQIAIDRVGVKGLRHPIQVRDRSGVPQHTIGTVALAVDLPAEVKGTHMSRFVEALNEQHAPLDIHNAADLPHDLLVRLHAHAAHVTWEFPFFRAKMAPVTRIAGLMDYRVGFDLHARVGAVFGFELTVVVPVSTLCPCSKAISARGAHNQRGEVTLSIRPIVPIWIEDLLDLVEASASCGLYSVLKRPDEKAVTEHAYDNPVFVEDLVRNVAQRVEALGTVAWYRVEAENFESIHNHSAYAVIEREPGGPAPDPALNNHHR